jgi:cadmium resistance protein CadD (predicted permease)
VRRRSADAVEDVAGAARSSLPIVQITLIGQAVGLFALTNVDDMVILALFFGQARGRNAVLRVVSGQYLGFTAILAASIIAALGAQLLPAAAIPYLGLLPLALGVRAAWKAWREHRSRAATSDERKEETSPERGLGVIAVAAVIFANGGDNIGVYVPVFAVTGVGELFTYVLVFLVLVAVWCVAGHFFANRPLVAKGLSRWGHLLLPIVLIGIGLVILIEGHAFGL